MELEIHNPLSVYYVTQLTNCVVNIICALVAVAGNVLVLAAIWRNHALRTPSYILLACVGLITQPIYIFTAVTQIITLKHLPEDTRIVLGSIGAYFCQVTFTTITTMSVERWLFMSRRSLLTVKRTCFIYVALLIHPLLFIAIL